MRIKISNAITKFCVALSFRTKAVASPSLISCVMDFSNMAPGITDTN